MKRLHIAERPNWKARLEELGFRFYEVGDQYWAEGIYYSFSMDEILKIESATAEVHQLCLEAVQKVITDGLYDRFSIPRQYVPLIEYAWEKESPAIYGRFDFSYQPGKDPKLLEYNADTPTSLFEASVVQWQWLQDKFPNNDQFNSIHEKLIAHWRELKNYLKPGKVHFSSVDTIEDLTTTIYLQDTAIQAGLDTQYIKIDDIGWDSERCEFVGLNEELITNIFKLYPWEWMVHESYGNSLIQDTYGTVWIEPIWKMILSNKAILPLLHEMFPNHKNILPAWESAEVAQKAGCKSYAIKPKLSREGANITLVKDGKYNISSKGEYGEEGFIYQALAELPYFDGRYPVIGSWMIDQEPAGIGIRECTGLITDNMSQFVPHIIELGS
jgi:glutathionylspermidine synthase